MTAISCALVFAAVLIWLLRRLVKLPGPVEVLTEIGRRVTSREKLRALGVRLEAVNMRVSPELFTALRFSSAIVLAVAGGALIWREPVPGIALLVLALIAYKLPESHLNKLEKNRKEEINREFPIMVDMVRI